MNVDALRCFSSPIINVDFDYTATYMNVEESVDDNVVRSCRLALKCVRNAGFTSIVVTCSSSFQRLYDPISVATHVGLHGVYGDIDSPNDSEAMTPILSPQLAVQEAEMRCRLDFEQGKTLSIAPGFAKETILYPLLLIKYRCFLHGGFCWNRETVLDIIGISTDIRMLEEVLNLTLLVENSLNVGCSFTKENESCGDDNSVNSENVLRKTMSSGAIDQHNKESIHGSESRGGFLFWTKHLSSETAISEPSFSNATSISSAPVVERNDFLMSLLSCSVNRLSDESERSNERRFSVLHHLEALSHSTTPPFLSPRTRTKSPKYLRLQTQSSLSVDFLAESEYIFWKYLCARTFEEFVTCCNSRCCSAQGSVITEGYSPSKTQALIVLKSYRRMLSSVGWKLDRKKMATLREKGVIKDVSDQCGVEIFSEKTGSISDGTVYYL